MPRKSLTEVQNSLGTIPKGSSKIIGPYKAPGIKATGTRGAVKFNVADAARRRLRNMNSKNAAANPIAKASKVATTLANRTSS